jgi:hypothetical protein
MENTVETETANYTSGALNPAFKNKVRAFQMNPFVKFGGFEVFGVLARAEAKASAEATTRVGQQQAVGPEPDAGVAVVVDDVGSLEHADAVDQLLLQVDYGLGFGRIGHANPRSGLWVMGYACRGGYQPTWARICVRQRSHARMPAVWLMWSASLPSSLSSAAMGAPRPSASVQCWMRALTSV